jgi:hypothetical protein
MFRSIRDVEVDDMQKYSRREFCKALAFAPVAASLGAEPRPGNERTFKLRYIVASSMYGRMKLSEILPEVRRAGAEYIDIWPENKKPIPGYTLEDCDQIYTANEINRVVRWNGESTVSKLAGKPIRLRFVMRDADLYAFQFRRRPREAMTGLSI